MTAFVKRLLNEAAAFRIEDEGAFVPFMQSDIPPRRRGQPNYTLSMPG